MHRFCQIKCKYTIRNKYAKMHPFLSFTFWMKEEHCLWKYWVQHVLDHLQSVLVQMFFFFFIQNIYSYIPTLNPRLNSYFKFWKRSGVLSSPLKNCSGVLSQYADFSGVLSSGVLSAIHLFYGGRTKFLCPHRICFGKPPFISRDNAIWYIIVK